ncbi:hypothetical protein ACC713_32285 [Rhizobium johnstonii]|uniref:hypothetical protein n=1 Tax=Rhizobium TaxID=379 RepID=UPI00103023CC|nr:hypothetical protein [Rhizobium leguminosarum]MBY5324805.1 hypothetical protein [Rhizobium leguminosarum]MBY5385615.1 hypothetical protein [Rhizobium leguminosarum]NEH69082.1 hypothetical protein [Rhizobium leguminosarum]TBF69312.1 hypothetical protein ELG86_30740 [Rhizobium leguminosarum]TBG55852.1 hypothetical protein ELG74_31480 [Rhizobium leguminosarum]
MAAYIKPIATDDCLSFYESDMISGNILESDEDGAGNTDVGKLNLEDSRQIATRRAWNRRP